MTNKLEIITQTINYIEENLGRKLDLNSISDALHYSKFYLHRTFTNATGMTIHDYIQRRQLTEAAKMLVFSQRTIYDIALFAGFESQQAFTSTFTAIYKASPGQYREDGQFYPLQLRFSLEEARVLAPVVNIAVENREIEIAGEADLPSWMMLVRLVIDGFPHLQEVQYVQTLQQYIKKKQAYIMKDNKLAIGIMLLSPEKGSIDFLGIHPLVRKSRIIKQFLDRAVIEMTSAKEVWITTYRKGDRADTGHRSRLESLGFAEAELLIEYGYPTQRFILDPESAKTSKEPQDESKK